MEYYMQIKYLKNINKASDGIQKVSAICWSYNNKRLAVATADRYIHLYDENGNHMEKFPTKSIIKGQKTYVVRSLQFSPDNQKLAVAQSDNIIFIYKLGLEWNEKKAIINKYEQTSSVTCMCWPNQRQNEIVFGLAEGKVRMGYIRKQYKSESLYGTSSYAVSIAGSLDGMSIISGHLDHSIIRMNLEKKEKVQIVKHSSVPYALDWGTHIIAAGNDQMLTFYDENGAVIQKFDYTSDDSVKEFTVANFNPSGESVAVGNFNKFFVYSYNARRKQWDETTVKKIDNYYSVTGLAWKKDGSKLTTGSLCGSVDMFDVSMKVSRYKGKFEFTHVSPSQVIVKRLDTGNRAMMKSSTGNEISKLKVYRERYVVGQTVDTMLLCDLETNKLSEIPWRGSGNEKFDFSSPNVCMIFNAGELSIVEYGVNEIIGTCRTEYLSPSLISARLSYSGTGTPTRIIAYLFDPQTIKIQDITNSVILATVEHDARIDYLALNQSGTRLIFKDKKKQLYYYTMKEQSKSTLLNFCTYVNWVQGTDVVVAQNKSTLCVWYSIDQPDKVTMYTIKGDVEGIEKIDGKTSVVVDCGNSSITYPLDEHLINFGMAVERGELEKAADILEPLDLTSETEANWKTLAKIALEKKNLTVAEWCYSALGNISKAKYLHGVNKLIRQFEEKTKTDGSNFYLVQAKLAILEKDFHRAEAILLAQNEVEEAMEMYQELHKWDESIRLAEMKNHPDVKELKSSYIQWLLQTNQEAKAAEVKEREGDYLSAISLYLKGGLPAKAAAVVNNYNMSYEQDVLEKVAAALTNAGLHEKAGDFFEKMSMYDRALDSYKKGHAYHKAVDIARRGFPQEVVKLEEEWGNWLVEQKQVEAAINHFIEAGLFNKAIEASVIARQWSKAVQLLRNQPPEVARPFYKQIAKHYADVRQYDLAEKHYINAGEYIDAFEMYVKANKWDAAYKMISQHLPESEIAALYVAEGQKYEKEQLYKEAERMYLTVNESDLAITMYKRAKQYDNMIRLVMKYRKELLKETHLHLGKQLEKENLLKQAERHYIEGGDWNQAVEMYRARDMWEDAIRVAKANGTNKDLAEIAKKWADTMETEQGVNFLTQLGLVEAAIDYLCEKKDFTRAFRLVETSAKYKAQDVHLEYALQLEDERRYKEAEEHFIKANKTSEAILMYGHLDDWHSALQVARQFAPEAVQQVYVDQAKSYLNKQDMAKAEVAFINARRSDMAIQEYLQRQMTDDALRVAKKYAPHLVPEILKICNNINMMSSSPDDHLSNAKMLESSGEYQRAISMYLQIDQSNYADADKLESIWDHAIYLAAEHDKEHYRDIVKEVGKRLEKLNKFLSAAELYENAQLYDSAVKCYVASTKWDQAENAAKQERNSELQNELIIYINKAREEFYRKNYNYDSMAKIGKLKEALDLMIKNGQWEECLNLASKNDRKLLIEYLGKFAKHCIDNGNFKEAGSAFIKYNCPTDKINFDKYETLALEMLAGTELNDQELMVVKEMMRTLCKNIKAEGATGSSAYDEFNKYADIAHLELLRSECKTLNLMKCYTKICISLLRYTKVVRIDKAFLDAGLACKDIKQYNMAFVILNRYLDLAEVIEDNENATALQEDTSFKDTDIPSPFETPFPDKNLLTEDKRNEIKDWVLKISVQHKAEQKLNTRKCDQCGTDIYEASMSCPNCKKSWEMCVASGYPLTKQGVVYCKTCQRGALKEYWTEYVKATQHCPWCKSVQSAF